MEAQERDIDELKKSVYELSYMVSMQVRRPLSHSGTASPALCMSIILECAHVFLMNLSDRLYSRVERRSSAYGTYNSTSGPGTGTGAGYSSRNAGTGAGW